MKARVIALYLPQFHPIPENNKWWGEGFTEWTNVGNAKALFRGHYQPRVPADLGYYDLRMPEIREKQAQLAKEHGIEGFMYWHYWFGNGRMLLEKPLQEVINSGAPDFPFCVGWANHSWHTKSWSKTNNRKISSTIMAQEYHGDSDYIEHFNYLLPAFLDKRYIKVDGKPIFYVFDPLDIPDNKRFISLWQNLAKKNGLSGIHFIAKHGGHIDDGLNLLDLGYNAVNYRCFFYAESQAEGSFSKSVKRTLKNKLNISLLEKYNYSDIISNFFSEYEIREDVYPTIFPQYDRSPRAGRRAVIYHNSNPAFFKEHCQNALELIKDKNAEHKIVFLKSWNEWGESNYVEPDLKYGHSYLNVIKDVFT